MADKRDAQGMSEHHASVMVNASPHEVYAMFSHFNDFPKFMHFVKEVTYYDAERSHWVAEMLGRHEWDAVNENWMEDRQIGWRSTSGLENTGRVTFQPSGGNQTLVDVYINYNPPAGILGDIGEHLGVGGVFNRDLQHDMDNFAQMVANAPQGALDPESSSYLFHSGSAAAEGKTTSGQNATMDNRDSMRTYSDTSATGENYPQGSSATTRGENTVGDKAIPEYPARERDVISETYPQDPGSLTEGGYRAGGNVTPERPVMDRDIISGQYNETTGTATTGYATTQGVMPQGAGSPNTVPGGNVPIPPDSSTVNPVTRPENGVAAGDTTPDRDATYTPPTDTTL